MEQKSLYDDHRLVADVIRRVSGVTIIDEHADLVDVGVKSLDMLRIIGAIEAECGWEFEASQLNRANFRSLHAICATVEQARLEAAGHGGDERR